MIQTEQYLAKIMQLIKMLVVNLTFYHDLNLIKKNNVPNMIVTIDDPKKDESI